MATKSAIRIKDSDHLEWIKIKIQIELIFRIRKILFLKFIFFYDISGFTC